MWVRSGASSWDIAVPSSDASECAASVEVPRGLSPTDEQRLLTALDTWSQRWLSLIELRARSPMTPLPRETWAWGLLQSHWCRHYADWVRAGRVSEAQRFLDRANDSLSAFNLLCGIRDKVNTDALASFLDNRNQFSAALLETLQSLGSSCAPGPVEPLLAHLGQLDAEVHHEDQGMDLLNTRTRTWTKVAVGVNTRWSVKNLRNKLRIACAAPSVTAQRPSSPGHPASGGPPQPEHH